jgi:acetate---CoA ligase (ADP-forming)
MLEARSVALIGASARPGSLGARMIEEVARSPSRPRTYLINPRYADIGGVPCLPDLAALPEPVDLAMLAVPDHVLEQQLSAAARSQARSAVIFGNAFDPPGRTGLRSRLTAIAGEAGMAVCGAGCMGFVNIARGLRAIGYVEPGSLPSGTVALVTHSGSVFSALLRTRRGFGFSLAVSSGQELVTTAADYARYALGLAETTVLALILEAIRDAPGLRAVLADALAADVPVVLLSVGASPAGQALVAAHSGALAAADGAWEALAGAYGLHRVRDLAELADTLELFASGRRAAPGQGIATVHDSGLERAHTADLAAELGVPFAPLAPATHTRLAAVLDPGLAPANPLDVWGTGRDTEPLFAECLSALAADPAVAAVALAVDLVPEFDGDESYPLAALTAAAGTAKPVAVLAGLPAAVDQAAAARLRAAGVPVLEGTRTGLLALRHLLDAAHVRAEHPAPPTTWAPSRAPGSDRLPAGGPALFGLLRDYGIPVVRTRAAATRAAALAAADEVGYPVVVKTDEPGIAHKSDVGGVRLGLAGPAEAGAAYDDLARRLGPRVVVCETAPPGTELALGIVTDPALGPLLVISAGGVLVEIMAERAVLLAPVTRSAALAALGRLRIASVLAGSRGQPAADLGAVADAITGLSRLACDLGDTLEALDINPLICTPSGAVAVDALLIPRPPPSLPR